MNISTRRRRGTRAITLVGTCAALLLGPALANATTTTGSVTMVSQSGDVIGAGANNLFDSSTGSVSVSGTLAGVEVDVSGGSDPSGSGFKFEFAPTAGHSLTAGTTYSDAGLYPATITAPGLSISGDGRSCAQRVAGGFIVKDIGTDASGNVDRLWLDYLQQCNGASAALFGEIRIGEPASTAPEFTEPASIVWPLTVSTVPGTTVPVTVIGSPAGAEITNVAITGADAQDFAVVDDTCTETALGIAARCQVSVTFTPTADGLRTAELNLTDDNGAVTSLQLAGVGDVLAPSTTTVTSANSTSVYGTPVAYAAAVTSTNGVTPTNSVEFYVDGFAAGAPIALNANGDTSTPLTAALDVGSSVVAAYGGDSVFAPSLGKLTPAITPAATALALSTSATSSNPASAAAPETFTATVSNTQTSPTPVGGVQFLVDGTPVQGPISLNSGQASLVTTLTAGLHIVTAVYGDNVHANADFVMSNASLIQAVAAVAPTTPPSLGVDASSASGFPNDGFVLGPATLHSAGRILIGAQAQVAGKFTFKATTISSPLAKPGVHGTKTVAVLFGKNTASTNTTNYAKLTVTPDAAAKTVMLRGKRLRLLISITFTPKNGGKPTTVVVSAVASITIK